MQKYFLNSSDFLKNIITGDDVNHIKTVMRMSVGEKIICSNEEEEYVCVITKIEKNMICFNKEMAIVNNNDLPFLVDIYQGYPKGDKIDDIVKHSVELGVNDIYGVITKRSIFKLTEDRKPGKIARFNKIAKEASEQSNRKKLSHFVDIMKLEKVDFSKYDLKIVCYEEASKNNEISNFKNCIKKIKPGVSVCVLIGPEGGLLEDEVLYLESKGFIRCGMGPRILRTETASMYALSAISYEWELK